jgi:phosphoribosylaminoimidazole-succinocarboxamide synthase
VRLVGPTLAPRVRDASLALYTRGAELARERGIIIADTKFELAVDQAELTLIDEVLTPDSSRFWPADRYAPGGPQQSFDKQYLRDYLDRAGWQRRPPAPSLPADVVANTRARYLAALTQLTGQPLA